MKFILPFLLLFFTNATYSKDEVKHVTVNDYLQQAKLLGKKANSLLGESSPYLLQHAYNPVDWYAWGDEAFDKAKKENKPIFLSIGYSTCHWCHVMAHESFENKEIAALLNKHFISIKVDREQRPDIDSVYMSATQLINGHGGWPMTVFLDHDLRPFHAATYYPPFTIQDRLGLKDVLLKIQSLWSKQPELIDQVATSITARITASADDTVENGVLTKNINELTLKQISENFDEDYGGFSAPPKFPRPGLFALLNKTALLDSKYSEIAGQMMSETLDAMAAGGIYDQLAGGFHRYSVDENWQVPHFEKMLYSQALMVMAYIDLYKVKPKKKYKQLVLETLNFVLHEMQSPEGGFYSALDADSEGNDGEKAEGAYYLWHESELKKILSKPEYVFVKKHYHTGANGNIESDPQQEFTDLNIFYIDEEFRAVKLTKKQEKWLASAKEKLNKSRLLRPRPHLDDKIITAWNGMMLSAFAKAAYVYDDSSLLKEAIKNLGFIKNHLYDKNSKKLYRQYRINKASTEATLADYTWLIYGLLEVYNAGNDERWLNWAIALHEKQNQLFLDKSSGAYFEFVTSDESLLFRSKSIYDGALPSANAIALSNLRKLSEISKSPIQKKSYSSQADKLVSSFATVINQNPAAAAMLLAVELPDVK